MSRYITCLLFILVSLTWGTTWLAMRIAVESIPPIFATGMRFIFSAPLIMFIAWVTKAPLLFPPSMRWFQLKVCLFYFSIPFSLMIYGEIYVNSGLASIIFAYMPVAILITSCLLLKEKVTPIQIIGLIVSIIALIGILLEESQESAAGAWRGVMALTAAVLMHAVMYAVCKKCGYTISVVTFNALPCLGAGLILLPIGFYFESPIFSQFSSYSLLAIIYLGVFAGVFGILSYFALQQRVSSFQASIVFLVFPLIAVGLEKYIYGYVLSQNAMLLMMPLFLGIFLILRNPPSIDGTRESKVTTSTTD